MASDTGFVEQAGPGYFEAGASYIFQYWSCDVASGASPCGTGANFTPAFGVVMSP